MSAEELRGDDLGSDRAWPPSFPEHVPGAAVAAQEHLSAALGSTISFRQRPTPLAPEFRTTWRLVQLLYLLSACCRGGKSSFRRLHVLNWAARSERNRAVLVRALRGQLQPHSLLVRVEPSLNRAVDLAAGEGLVTTLDGARIEITDRGRVVVKEALALEDCLITERAFVRDVGMRVTEKWVNETLTSREFP